MKLLFLSEFDNADHWREVLQSKLPGLEFIVWQKGDAPQDDIDYALVWKPPVGVLKSYTGLKAILSLGAGVDGILCDLQLPTHVPIVRLVDPGLANGMAEYIIYWTLHFHRKFDVYARFAADNSWKPMRQPVTKNRTVGIMGMGEMGRNAANKLSMLGFRVIGWSRSEKAIAGVQSYYGEAGFDAFLNQTEILINLLPLTEATTGLINAASLAALPKDSVLINAGRGGHVVDADLLAALDSGHLRAAVLDVFHTEPLPADHLYWSHPKVTITPHVASLTQTRSAADTITRNILRVERGETPENVIDLEKGY